MEVNLSDNRNNSVWSSASGENPSSTQAFDLTMGVYLPGIFCVLGALGNIISLFVLSSDKGNYPTFMSLKALAASDVVLLLSALLQQVIPIFCMRMRCHNSFCDNLGYVRVYVWPIVCIAQMNTIWLTVLISAERYSAICRPLHAKRMRNLPKVRLAVFTLGCISVLFNLPRFFEFQPITEPGTNNITLVVVGDTKMRRNVVYRYFYNTALYCLVMYITPLIVLTFLNLNIVRKMRVATRCWEDLNRLQQRELRATTIPLCIVLVFFLTNTQSLISFIIDAVFVDEYYEWIQVYTAVANLLVIINSAVNFLIFYVFGSKFRKLLRHLIYCKLYTPTLGAESPIFRKRFATRLNNRDGQSFCRCSNPSAQFI